MDYSLLDSPHEIHSVSNSPIANYVLQADIQIKNDPPSRNAPPRVDLNAYVPPVNNYVSKDNTSASHLKHLSGSITPFSDMYSMVDLKRPTPSAPNHLNIALQNYEFRSELTGFNGIQPDYALQSGIKKYIPYDSFAPYE
jgi:hypothetical protein